MHLTYKFVVARALAAGLAAGLLLALYTLVVVEPTIDTAIALEEAVDATAATTDSATHDEAEPIFTRDEQYAGGMLAMVIFAVIVSLIFGTVYAKLQHRLGDFSEFGRAVWLAAVAFGSLALIPALKYPANPPAVGDQTTASDRTVQYAVLIALSIALAMGLVRLSGWLRSRFDDPTRLLTIASATLGGYALLLITLPGTPDAIAPAIPAKLVWDFRLQSLGGLALMWATIGLGLGWALERAAATEPASTEPELANA